MVSVYLIGIVVLAYLFGSIPSAVWLGGVFYGVDVREYGSGNAGATNTFRVLGRRAGTIVMCVDILKGWASTNLPHLLDPAVVGVPGSRQFTNIQLALGVIAVLGHLFRFLRASGAERAWPRCSGWSSPSIPGQLCAA